MVVMRSLILDPLIRSEASVEGDVADEILFGKGLEGAVEGRQIECRGDEVFG